LRRYARADSLYIEHYHYRLYDPTKSVLSILSFLNFVIRLSDDSGINEKFLSLTTEEKYRNTPGTEIYG